MLASRTLFSSVRVDEAFHKVGAVEQKRCRGQSRLARARPAVASRSRYLEYPPSVPSNLEMTCLSQSGLSKPRDSFRQDHLPAL